MTLSLKIDAAETSSLWHFRRPLHMITSAEMTDDCVCKLTFHVRASD